ncbi:phospholipase D/nuclease [Aulographum hederae CBS 113979]|uniref:phospholipase D n=1 Tax=Aulographum hederae CBS 113979 TaxID=1176131 RepID=A0A6G1H167_9PEZI|nr:phospholipase D/nuclease [Aulographum hederae CBS 113979]
MADDDDHLAYGDFHGQGYDGVGDRSVVGDIYHRFRPRKDQPGQQPAPAFQDVTQAYQPHLQGQQPQSTLNTPDSPLSGSARPTSSGKPSSMSFLFDKMHTAVHQIGSEIKGRISTQGEQHGHTSASGECTDGAHDTTHHRFQSFAPRRSGNDVKWYVDGCGYMWAVSVALEQARETIWILDWWLSPELYLRRPPAKNQQYRIDHMLHAAAQRGVKVNIIVYKEVTQALTRKLLNPALPDYLHSLLPHSTDTITRGMTRVGLDIAFESLEELERTNPLIAPPVTVSSAHTKHALEDLHPNISVFRHPDHLPDRQNLTSSFISSFQNAKLTAAGVSKLPLDGLKAIYGMNDDAVLYWAHHEKLCLIDGRVAFMGGLDLCYGRWDTNQHQIADAHPGDLNQIIFPGQDYNNARIMDFQDVPHWESNKLDRTKSSRMGWSDLSICLSGPVVEDLKGHFVERWNFIYNEKYDVRKDTRYTRLSYTPTMVGVFGELDPQSGTSQAPPPAFEGQNPGYGSNPGPPQAYGQSQCQEPYFPPPPGQYARGVEETEYAERGLGEDTGERGFGGRGGQGEGFRDKILDRFGNRLEHAEERYGARLGDLPYVGHHIKQYAQGQGSAHLGGIEIQLTRSCAKWSHGISIQHSIANAYIQTIRESKHFIYIENQFFITATNDKQKPIKNKIGAAIAERIIRAARNNEPYMMFVMMPAVPAFAGDLKSDDALATRAIMEFQYDSINRGGYSIMETIAQQGINPMNYIRFYNLRSYDRINSSGAMADVEKRSGVAYEDARKQFDATHGGGYPDQPQVQQIPGEAGGQYQAYHHQGQATEGYGEQPQWGGTDPYHRYQEEASKTGSHQGLGTGRWDSVAECYMLGGEDIRKVPWENGNVDEIDAFVSEELYIHSKLLIADDRIVICGSANLNDRSQLGDHDSEIAVVIEDPAPVDSYMAGQPWRASKFATSLRRQLFRKHLGLIPAQNFEKPDENFQPIGVPNVYDWGSPEDQQVIDPLSPNFQGLWNSRAKTNTDAFAKLFHPVPFDGVRNWKQYDEYYERFFHEDAKDKANVKPSKYKWGHVVAEEFSPGEQGLREVKELLSTIKGTLVEMPLLFLKEEDIAKEGLGLNAFTEEVYT